MKVEIEFVRDIVGHDLETIKQMYNDWNNSPSTKIRAKSSVNVEAEVKVNFAERIIEEEIEKLEKLANEYNEDMDTEGYINNLNDSNILHRVLIRIKSESKISP